MKELSIKDAIQQAQWEIELEDFEALVVQEKVRLREKKAIFPWRLKLVNLNSK